MFGRPADFTVTRIVEIRPAEETVRSLVLQAGDLLLFWATGGHVRSGANRVELLGPFRVGVLGTDGRIHTPEGPPSKVVFRALRPGQAEIDLVIGDPWSKPWTLSLSLTVE